MRSAGYSDPSFARLADLAHLLAGLVFPANRQPSAEAGMRRAMSALRINDPAQLLRAAESPGPMREAILAELTVGESYFFRDEAQLKVLANEVVPALVGTRGPDRPLRVWSAGCASGEEPYTVAILLRELGWPHPAQILGTDVAMPRLEAARRGRYTRWALRGVADQRVQQWFRRTSSYFELDPTIRSAVEFRELNLVHDEYGSGGTGYDLVLCRNVMIYFDLETVARIAERLLDSLNEDGWLVLGASDPPLAQLVACEPVMTVAGMAYRRPSAAKRTVLRLEHAAAPSTGQPASRREWNEGVAAMIHAVREAPHVVLAVAPSAASPESDDMHAAYERADYVSAEAMAIAALAGASDVADTLPAWILYVRAVANQGRLADAGELCARALEIHPLSAELHYLHAMLLAESGWHADAAVAARRSIYLDRTFVLSHMVLGDALTRTRDPLGARRAFENVLRLVASTGAHSSVPGSDGVTAARIHQIAQLRVHALARETTA
jgi:chemotaxis protein methyltransferase CheR